MKRIINCIVILSLSLLSATFCNAQNIGIGTTTPHSSALLDVTSSTKGFLPPRMTSALRTAIAGPQKGLMVFDTNTASYWFFGDGGWKELSTGGSNSDSTVLVGELDPVLGQYTMPNSGVFDTSGIVFDSGGEFGNYGNNESLEATFYPSLAFNALAVKVTIMQMTLENINDTVTIFGNSGQRKYFTGTVAPQQFILNGSTLVIKTKTNGSVVAAGFKIRFDFIFPPPQQSGITQISGWTYIPSRLAVRGGFDAEFSSHPDSIGQLSFGYGNGVLAKGPGSIAMGSFTNSMGYYSVAMGSSTKATANYSIAMGDRSAATGSHALAVGYIAEASGSYSTAIGYLVNATGSTSFAANNSTSAIGSASASFGEQTRAHGSKSIATGYFTEAFGVNSIAGGSFTNARGENSLALGAQADSYGINSVSIGEFTDAIGPMSFAFGEKSKSTGELSMAFGKETTSRAYASVTIGQYNDSIISANPDVWISTDPAFIIGNGTVSSKRNAFIVDKTGRTGLNITGLPQALLHLKGTSPSSFDSQIRLETAGALTDYVSIVYDGDMKFRTFGAADSYQWRDLNSNQLMTLGSTGNLSIDGTLSQGSDSRLKRDISPLQNSLQKILALGGYQYYWIDSTRDKNIQTGVLAQEVEKQMPELVTTDNDGMKAVNYSGLVPYLIESIKELKKENDEMKKEILLLKKKMN